MKACVLSSGGNKGAYHLGVLRKLLNGSPDLDYDIYCGTSAGALNSSILATGKLNETLPKLENIWLHQVTDNSSVRKNHLWYYILAGIILIVFFLFVAFFSFLFSAPKLLTVFLLVLALGSFYVPYYSLTHTHSYYTTEPLRALVEANLDLDKLKNSGKYLRIGAINFNTGKYESATEKTDNIIDWVMASSAFPILFPMQKIGDYYYTDGGMSEMAPLIEAIELGATEIDIILANPIECSPFDGQPGIFKQLTRNLDIISAEILRNDITTKCKIHSDKLNIRIFGPKRSLTENSLSFYPKRIKRIYDEGMKEDIY